MQALACYMSYPQCQPYGGADAGGNGALQARGPADCLLGIVYIEWQ